jgi:hypothetical protein
LRYIDNVGIEGEADYPFENRFGNCRYDGSKVRARLYNYDYVESGNETDLMRVLVQVGPVPALIDASQPSFQFYESGVYYEPACRADNPDHLLMLAGYGSLNGQQYFLAKNRFVIL